jgi:hypothetical protein
MAVEATDRRFFGSLYEQAIAYRACHLFTVMKVTSSSNDKIKELGGGAPVASVTEGKLSVSFAQSGGSVDVSALGSTKYGRMLLALIKTRPTLGVNQAGGYVR